MLKFRSTLLVSAVVVSWALAWRPNSVAQEEPASATAANATTGIVTVFDKAKLRDSFARADTGGGSNLLWSRDSPSGTYDVQTHARDSVKNACKPEGCSHKGYTAVVYVVSGSATLVVGGAAKSAISDKFGGQAIQGGESHRVSEGDVYIVPPDTIHWYKDVTPPFRYIEIPVP